MVTNVPAMLALTVGLGAGQVFILFFCVLPHLRDSRELRRRRRTVLVWFGTLFLDFWMVVQQFAGWGIFLLWAWVLCFGDRG